MPATFLPIGCILAGLSACWGLLALAYQLPGPSWLRWLGAASWLAVSCGLIAMALQHRNAYWLAAYAVAFVLLLGWWQANAPSNQRDWADDVAQMTTGELHGDVAILHNVRNFEWRSATDYTVRWETREYDLDQLRTVDLVASYWMGPAIAHTLVSFGFADGSRVVFSVEIRKERHESFSAIGGFFKQFETSVIAADERDIVRVRSNVRGEDVYLYRVYMRRETMRSLFEAYVEEANRLVHTPRFYHTLTANCTTIVYHMMRRLVDGLPMDYRLVLSGYLPGYIHRLGALAPGYALQTLRERGRIGERARAAGDAPDFSARIRDGVPGHDGQSGSEPGGTHGP